MDDDTLDSGAAYLAALERERAGYKRTGSPDQVKDVDAEMKRFRRDVVKARTATPPDAATTAPDGGGGEAASTADADAAAAARADAAAKTAES
jgi:hypothetical protein